MREKIVNGILVRQVRTDIWVSYNADVWMENVGVPSKFRTLTTNRWHRSRAKTRVKVNGELRYRLVAEAWVNNPDPKLLTLINHLDGNPTNDIADNLEWSDHSSNGQHAYDTGLSSSDEQLNINLRRFTDDEEKNIHKVYKLSKASNKLKSVSKHFGISIGLLKKINKKWRQ